MFCIQLSSSIGGWHDSNGGSNGNFWKRYRQLPAYKTKKHPSAEVTFHWDFWLCFTINVKKLTVQTRDYLCFQIPDEELLLDKKGRYKCCNVVCAPIFNVHDWPTVPKDRLEKLFHFLRNYLIQMMPGLGTRKVRPALTRWYLIWDTLTRHHSKYFLNNTSRGQHCHVLLPTFKRF